MSGRRSKSSSAATASRSARASTTGRSRTTSAWTRRRRSSTKSRGPSFRRRRERCSSSRARSGDNDPAQLKENNRAALADLSAHEGFPGHDWHYKIMTQYRDQIAWVRWLTPGAVEDSSAMWEDSLAAEGWAHYAEALVAEPQTGAPDGFYTPEERLYQLQGQLYRDLRVRVDTGLHTGRISFDDAVDLFSQVVDFQPGKCSDAQLTDSKRASCKGAQAAIFRYSKWPTQAITYRLGKDQIYALR